MMNKTQIKEYITPDTAFVILPSGMKRLSLITKHGKFR